VAAVSTWNEEIGGGLVHLIPADGTRIAFASQPRHFGNVLEESRVLKERLVTRRVVFLKANGTIQWVFDVCGQFSRQEGEAHVGKVTDRYFLVVGTFI
jgi:hypothetical protein